MNTSKQALIYPRPSSVSNYGGWILLGYVALAVLALAVVAAVQGPGVPDPSFATAAVLP